MRNAAQWRESKYSRRNGRLYASRDRREVGLGSRLIADLLAVEYAKALQSHARGSLLDLGCGKAPLYTVYGPLVQEALCIDWGNTLHPNPYLDLEHDLNQPLPLADACLDTILATDVLEHLAHPEVFWSECARLLRPGGKVIVGVPFLYQVHEAPFDFHRYTEFKLRDFCVSHGLEVIDLHSYGGSLEVLADITAKHLAFSAPLSAVHLAVAGALTQSPVGAKVRGMTAARFPLGYVLVAQKPMGR